MSNTPTLKAQRETVLKKLYEKTINEFYPNALEELRAEGEKFFMRDERGDSYYVGFDELPELRQQQLLGDKLRQILRNHLLTYTVLSDKTLWSYIHSTLAHCGCTIERGVWKCPLQPRKIPIDFVETFC